jgi:hypothetical protein
MATLEDWWIAGDFKADRAACLAKLTELAALPAAPPVPGA